MRVQLGIALLVAAIATSSRQSQEPQRPLFRSRTAAVPVDVRVVDRSGLPVIGLRREDFTIYEDGNEQAVSHFAARDRRNPDQGEPDRSGRGFADQWGPRTFAFVLGRGRLKGPAHGVSSLLNFVKTGLRDDDRIILVAYGRRTELTTNHEAVARLIERFAERHEEIEAALSHWFSGLQVAFGSPGIPASIAAKISAIFEEEAGLETRELITDISALQESLDSDRQSTIADILAPDSDSTVGRSQAAARHEIEWLGGTIEFVRRLPGEKHLVLLTAEAFHHFGAKTTDMLAEQAADARITLSTIQTGGLPLEWSRRRPEARGLQLPVLRSRTRAQMAGVLDARVIAKHTGGLSFGYRNAADALLELNRHTQAGYLLGYYPTNTALDGSYRTIRIVVRTPGAAAHYRQGYFSRDHP